MHPLELSRDEFPETWAVIAQGLQNKVAPGFVVGIWQKRKPDLFRVQAWGNRREVPSPQPMLPDTVFDLASLTKVLATTPLVATWVDRGWLSWDTPVAALIADYPYRDVEIQHLLSHTAGFVWWKPYWQMIRDSSSPQSLMRELILAEKPEGKPATKMVYSDVSFLLLGFVMETLTGQSLDQAVRNWVWKPMELDEFKYRPGSSDLIAATEQCPWRGKVLQGEVHDDNCWAMGGCAGHAGVFGTALEVLKFIRGLAYKNFLSPKILQKMWTPFAPHLGERTLGWDTPSLSGSSAGTLFSRNSVGHLGFVGTSVWYDRDAELAVVLLSNRVHPSRENTLIKEFRPKFHDAVRRDLERIE